MTFLKKLNSWRVFLGALSSSVNGVSLKFDLCQLFLKIRQRNSFT